MSQDTNERLVQHTNKTAVASPTAKHWLSACFLFLQLRPALLHSTLHARKQAFIGELFWKKVPPFPWNRCMPLRENSRSTWSLSVICQRRQWSEEDRGEREAIKFEGSTAQKCQNSELTHFSHDGSNCTCWHFFSLVNFTYSLETGWNNALLQGREATRRLLVSILNPAGGAT